MQKFGVRPQSIPDYLALVGDAADGYPGAAGLGREIDGGGAGQIRASGNDPERLPRMACERYERRRARRYARREWEHALLFRKLATLRTDITLFDDVEQLRWKGPKPEFETIAAELDSAVTGSRKGFSTKSAS